MTGARPAGDTEPRHSGGVTDAAAFCLLMAARSSESVLEVTWKCVGELRDNPTNLFTKQNNTLALKREKIQFISNTIMLFLIWKYSGITWNVDFSLGLAY